MKHIFKTCIQVSCILMLVMSCGSDDETETRTFEINFKNVVGDNTVELNTSTYDKNGDETFRLSELKYIISNIVLIDVNGEEIVYPQADSYFLINEELQSSKDILLQNIEKKEYTAIRFGVGVDQSNYPLNGVNNFVPTAVDQDMTWSWSAGYIFYRMEGSYTSDSETDKTFRYHMGSHGTDQDNYREVTLYFPESAFNQNNISIELDVLKVFDSVHSLRLSDKDDIQVDYENAPKIAENITNAFQVFIN